jgi:hypothetical protein
MDECIRGVKNRLMNIKMIIICKIQYTIKWTNFYVKYQIPITWMLIKY